MRFGVGAIGVGLLAFALLRVVAGEPSLPTVAGSLAARAERLASTSLVTRRHHQRGSSAKQIPSGRRVQSATNGGSSPEADPFLSPARCLELLALGQRASRGANSARIATWNVRWFPDGVPDEMPDPSRATNIEWMACAIAFMNVDAVALEEVKPKVRSAAALGQLTARLDALTNGRHTVHLDECPDENGQHLAWLVNEQRVTADQWATHAPINPNGDACAGQLRPGLGVRLRFLGGLDLYAIAVHLKSGATNTDLTLRRSSIDGLERVIRAIVARNGDADVLVAGDFNSMGCRECPEPTRSSAEAAWLDTRLRAFRPEVRRVPADLGCSEYYRQQPALLDHFLVARAMQEANLERTAKIFGYCRQLGCDGYTGTDPAALTQLSDHCPVVMALVDQDID